MSANALLLAEIDRLRERLRIAEAVRDDARAASQRYLDEKRAAQGDANRAADRLQRMLDTGEQLRAARPMTEDLTAAWKKGVQESIDKLYAAAVSGVVGASDPNSILLPVGRIVELLNILMEHPP